MWLKENDAMAVPKYYEMQKPFLMSLQDGKTHSKKEIREYIRSYFQLSDEDVAELHPNSGQSVFGNRSSWAGTYLKKAGLITAVGRAVFQITPAGQKVLKENPAVIDANYLSQFDAFREFQSREKTVVSQSEAENDAVNTPDDTLEDAINRINASLSDDLMTEIMKISPVAFEKMVLDLMRKMGYGTFANSSQMTSTTGDEGIDGIIMQDKLGFDLIYIQAKRWSEDHIVGRPEIQAFVGAISGKGGNGLFVTTSRFSKQAIDYAKQQHIILIDGKKLTALMIEYNFGVSVQKTFEIKSLDTDVFYEYQDE